MLARGPVLEIAADALSVAPASQGRVSAGDGAPSRASSVVHDGGNGGAATLEAVERRHIVETLERASWVIDGPSGAAAALGMRPSTLRSRMKKLGVSRPSA